MTARCKIRLIYGETVSATHVGYLGTITHGSGCYSTADEIRLYRTQGRRLVVCTEPANDARAIPDQDPSLTPEMYGYQP